MNTFHPNLICKKLNSIQMTCFIKDTCFHCCILTNPLSTLRCLNAGSESEAKTKHALAHAT